MYLYRSHSQYGKLEDPSFFPFSKEKKPKYMPKILCTCNPNERDNLYVKPVNRDPNNSCWHPVQKAGTREYWIRLCELIWQTNLFCCTAFNGRGSRTQGPIAPTWVLCLRRPLAKVIQSCKYRPVVCLRVELHVQVQPCYSLIL